MSRAISAELKPANELPKPQSQRAAYGRCDHRRLNPPGGLARDRLRQLALGAASEISHREALDAQDLRFGSDFADVIPLGRGRVVLALGDVSVMDLTAAQCVPQVLNALRQLLREPVPAACVLSRLNRSLCRSGLPAGCPSVALSLLVVDVETGKTVSACAGSEPPLILRSDGSVEAVNSGHIPLGVNLEQTFRAVDFLLGKGDALLLATNGITEAGRTSGEGDSDLSYEGLVGLALDAFSAGGPPGQIARTVLGGAKAFAGGRLHDDASVLVAIRQ